jgi:hypothetical protein
VASSDDAQTGTKAALSRDFSTFPSRDMPPPEPLRKMVGPGVIMVAVGVGSGEYILHPYITVQAGLVFLWAAALGVATQYFLNTEVERYTLATGETAVTGFVRMWKGWAPLFAIMTIVPWAWPGWMTSAAVLVTYLTGGGNTVAIAIAGLVIMGLILTVSPVVYQTVEKLEFLKVAAILVFAVVVVAFVIGVQPWVDLGKGTVQGFGRLPEGIPIAVVMSALVFAGGGGTINLTMSNWIRDKGWGMGRHIPRLVSPITGEEEAATTSTGYSFPLTDENLSRWNVWWKNSRVEQFWTFLVIGVMSIVMFSVLAYSVVPQGTAEGANLGFIQIEGELLGEAFGPWLKYTFWLIGAVSLMFANLVIIDMVGRVVADIFKNHYFANNTFWSESKLYFAIVWAEVLFGSLILLSGMDQPLVLLVTAAVLNGVVMAIYTILLIRLNRKALPAPVRVGGVRLGALVWAFILYGGFSLLTASKEIPKLFGAGS